MLRIVGGLLLVVVLVFGLQLLASETGEVVVLHARDPAGAVVETRLWVVDLEGRQYLRAGADGPGWFARLSAQPEIELTRGPSTLGYLATPEPARSAAINALMQQKYGWRDTLIGVLVGGREGSIPVRLEPR
ncbi:MAG: hypothetical protein R3E86_15995 [Pseudomonadales bacterium]